ncbi:hypothetical protein HHS34_005895 [Acidithiobacillus montserratensis]|uniref:Uncharacterized protein n=1 Tax=Acidithiobacillus montserratensis TaxID=2729135 RepID=A0ACD5HIB0_9PROT|nr:hypothetical protein [Acidithiobacillus montserratensis]MBN2679008.1 hypothetical protein [Acidithiobacillaceae bacterium]MBU2747098.1 hypothetical protein [Acidithiobacillus montserratensis]
MKKSLTHMLVAFLIATPFLALGSFVHAVTPLHGGGASVQAHAAGKPDFAAVLDARQTVAHLESAKWLQLRKTHSAIRTWSL